MKVLVVGSDLRRTANAALQMRGVETYLMSQPEPRTRRQIKVFSAVVVVVGKDDLKEQSKWENWLRKNVYGQGIAISWSTFETKD